MKIEEFRAIEERDRQAERCATCSMPAGGRHDTKVEDCFPPGSGRECSAPEDHHPFVAGGVAGWDEAEQDRRDLLGLVRGLMTWIVDGPGYPLDAATFETERDAAGQRVPILPPDPTLDLIAEVWREQDGNPVDGPTIEDYRDMIREEAGAG